MKVGDLVGHAPHNDKSVTRKLYADWGHDRDFKSGIIIQSKDGFRKVMPSERNTRPAWYQVEELELLSES